MDSVIFLAFATVYAALLVWSLVLVARRRRVVASDLVCLVILGLVYDNAIIGVGAFVGEGEMLESANAARYWLHAFFTPLLVLVAWHIIVRTGVKWATRAWALVVAVVLTIGLVVYEILVGAAGIDLVPEREYGALSYSDADASEGPPLMVLAVAAVLLIAAITAVVKQRLWWLFVGTVLMLIGSAVTIPVPSGALTNAFELVLLVSIVGTIAQQDARVRDAARQISRPNLRG